MATAPNAARLTFTSLHSDIVSYRILRLLLDIDTFHLLQTCKYIYYRCLPKYNLKNELAIANTILHHPSFQLDSTRPIPIIERGRFGNIDDLHKTRVYPKQIKSLRLIREPQNLDDEVAEEAEARINDEVNYDVKTNEAKDESDEEMAEEENNVENLLYFAFDKFAQSLIELEFGI